MHETVHERLATLMNPDRWGDGQESCEQSAAASQWLDSVTNAVQIFRSPNKNLPIYKRR